MQLTTGVTDDMACFISSPKRCYCGSAILASWNNVCSWCSSLTSSVVSTLFCWSRSCIGLSEGEMSSLGYTIVVCGTAIAALLASSAITSASARTRARGDLVGRDISCTSWRSCSSISGRNTSIMALTWCWAFVDRRNWLRLGTLQIRWPRLIPRFEIQTAGIADCFASWRAAPQRRPSRPTIALFC